MSTSDDTEIVRGHVKWFDPAKGFGFVVAETDGPDILLHANVLRNFGQSSVADGAVVEVVVQQTPRGRQAVEVKRIEPPVLPEHGAIGGLIEELIDPASVGPVQPARVKWFDKSKGFGFANAFGSSEDIFIHIEVLRRSGLADLQPGEAICIRVVSGRRGLMAAVVSSWETAASQPDENE
jgi:CspA family cold shock protein